MKVNFLVQKIYFEISEFAMNFDFEISGGVCIYFIQGCLLALTVNGYKAKKPV